MKITRQQLASTCQQQWQLVYHLVGDDPLLIDDCRKLIRKVAKQQGFSDYQSLTVQQTADWQTWQATQQQASLFAEKQLVDCDVSQVKFTEKTRKNFLAELANPDPNTCVIIRWGKLSSAQQKAKWMQALIANHCVVIIWPLQARELASFIQQRFAKAGFQLESATTQWLADNCQGNSLALKQWLEHCRLLFEPGPLAQSELEKLIEDNARYSVFDLTDTILAGDTVKALRMLKRLRQEGCESILVLWALSKECRLLSQLQQAKLQSADLAALFRQHGIWQSKQGYYRQALTRPIDWQQGLLQAFAIDKAIKGLGTTCPWQLLEALLLWMTGQALVGAA